MGNSRVSVGIPRSCPDSKSISAATSLNFVPASIGLVDCRYASCFGGRLLLQRPQAAHRSHFIDRQHTGLEKLHLHSRMEAVVYAVREKLLDIR